MTIETYPALPSVLKMLAHDLRWQLVSALAYSDYRVQELVDLVARPMNVVSYHLRQLRDHSLVIERRSTADGRDHYYTLDLDKLRQGYFATGAALHPALDPMGRPADETDLPTTLPPTRVLFLCTQNSARSQMAEALLRHLGRERVEVFSAGSEPAEIHPLAIRTIAGIGIDMRDHRCKHMSEFFDQDFDCIVTVCDRARESCPTFPGDPERIHWSFPDPAAELTSLAQERAFDEIARQLTTRIHHLLIIIDRQRKGQV